MSADPAAQCETAVTSVELVHHLPPRLLGAISLTESGRPDAATGRMRPWPWTINAEGEGHFFATQQKAVAAVESLQARGVTSIDVGCMQVNLMFHPKAFASLEDAFNPRMNADYAARFLTNLHATSNDWAYAIGAYHSETPVLGNAYRRLVMARWQGGNAPVLPLLQDSYQAFAPHDRVYRAFIAPSRTYGAFVPR